MTPQKFPKMVVWLADWMVLTSVAYLTVMALCYLVVINHFGPLINHHKEDLNLTHSIEVDDNEAMACICLLQ